METKKTSTSFNGKCFVAGSVSELVENMNKLLNNGVEVKNLVPSIPTVTTNAPIKFEHKISSKPLDFAFGMTIGCLITLTGVITYEILRDEKRK